MVVGGSTLTGTITLPEDTVLCVDSSGSMFRRDYRPSRFGAAKQAALEFVQKKRDLDSRDRFALLSFSSEVSTEQGLTNQLGLITTKINEMRCGGNSKLGEGLATSVKLLIPEIRKGTGRVLRIVVLSDGRPWKSERDPVTVAKAAGALRIYIDCVGVGSTESVDFGEQLLQTVAQSTRGEYTHVSDVDSLIRAFVVLADKKQITMGTPTSSSSAPLSADGIAREVGARSRALGPSLLETIARPLLRPPAALLIEFIEALRESHITEKCAICHSSKCLYCLGEFYVCGAYCPNCRQPYHVHCLAKWLLESNNAESNTFNCPLCQYLLKIELHTLSAMRLKSLNQEEVGVKVLDDSCIDDNQEDATRRLGGTSLSSR